MFLFIQPKFAKVCHAFGSLTEGSSHPKVFCGKGDKNSANFAGKHIVAASFLIKLQTCNFIRKRGSDIGVFVFITVNLAKFLRAPFLAEQL